MLLVFVHINCFVVICKFSVCNRAFSFAAPTVFNALPHFIRRDSNFNSFKSSLKTYLFQIAYCT